MIHKVILTYKDGIYFFGNIKDRLLEKITYLLRSEVGYRDVESFKKSLLNPEIIGVHCNLLNMDKEDDIIRMSDGYIEDYEERLFYSAEIKRDELVSVLDQWAEICKTMPPYIIITRDGETVTLHGCETLDEN